MTTQLITPVANIVVVPDLAAVDLTALAKREFNLSGLDNDHDRWDYYTDLKGQPIRGRGLKFKVMIYRPEIGSEESVSSEAVRVYLRECKFYGHTGAFTQWCRTCGLIGRYASIPEDDACYRDASGYLRIPYFYFGGGSRLIDQCWLDGYWDDRWSFVGFREVA
ncbi:MAG: hypothetical protein PHS79_00060 [Patescibacteria group bacterium]|nr:hypothetical protein [Patescibacteria group bacterium]